MNKNGKGGMAWVILAVAVALIVQLAVPGGWKGVFGGSTTTPVTNGDVSVGCSQNPSLGIFAIDALVPNQNLSPTSYNYRVNEKYIGTSYATPSAGDKVDLIADVAGYLAGEVTGNIKCGPNNFATNLYGYNNATVTIYTDAGTSVLSNNYLAAVGLVNETAFSTGGLKNWKVHIIAPTQKSTGKIFAYVEMPTGSAPNVSSISFSGLPIATIPSYVTSTNTNAYRIAFEIPALVNGEVKDYNLQASLVAAKILTVGTVRITLYAEQMFVDTDGSFKTGIYDALGNTKYQDIYGYNFGLGVTA